jgi:hypothetical protein
MNARIALLASLAALGSACSSSAPAISDLPQPDALADPGGLDAVESGPTDPGPQPRLDVPAMDSGPDSWGLPFFLGVEYTEKGLAPIYATSGIRWAKTRLEEFSWGATEPEPPVNGIHAYDWTCTDRTVLLYQSAGFTGIQSYVEPRSPWGSARYCAIGVNRANCAAGDRCDTLPCPEFMADFRAWMSALVERYDQDGTDDMPGLTSPIRLWVIAPEWTGFWPSGDADGYLILLAAAREAALAADPQARLGLIPFFLSDVFQGDPSPQRIAERLMDPPPGLRNSTAGMMRLLDHPELFDYVDLHSLGDYTEIPPMLAWIAGEMAKRGYSRPVVFDDAFPIGALANWHPAPGIGLPAMYPVTEEIYPQVYDLLVAVAKLKEPAYTPAMRWIRAETSAGTVKKAVTAAGEGAAGLQMGNLEDWMHDTMAGERHVKVNFIGAAAMMGMVDVSHAHGYGICDERTAGSPRPAFQSLKLLAAKVLGFDSVQKLSLAEPGAWAYRFSRAGSWVLVAWHEDRVLQLPPEVETPVPVSLPIDGAVQAKVTHTIIEVGQVEPESEIVPIAGGKLVLDLTSVPVFVEPW